MFTLVTFLSEMIKEREAGLTKALERKEKKNAYVITTL